MPTENSFSVALVFVIVLTRAVTDYHRLQAATSDEELKANRIATHGGVVWPAVRAELDDRLVGGSSRRSEMATLRCTSLPCTQRTRARQRTGEIQPLQCNPPTTRNLSSPLAGKGAEGLRDVLRWA